MSAPKPLPWDDPTPPADACAEARVHVVPSRPVVESTPAILVVGAHPGAGVTTTVLGLATVIATTTDIEPVAVDATVTGGDLAVRGADELLAPITTDTWLSEADPVVAVADWTVLSRSSSGAGILCEDTALRRGAGVVEVGTVLAECGFVPVYDGGASVASPHLLALLADGRTQLVVTTAGHRWAADRIAVTLRWLSTHFGPDVAADTTVVVSHHLSGHPMAGEALPKGVRPGVRAVVDVPYDPHLATGGFVEADQFDPVTAAAYSAVVEGVWS